MNALEMSSESWTIVGPLIGGLLAALIGGSVAWITSANRIKADLRASTRLEWIKEVRELTARIINSYYQIQRYYNSAVEKYPPKQTSSYQDVEDYEKLKNELISLSNDITLFELYFSTIKVNPVNVQQPNIENIYIRKLISRVKKEATQGKVALDSPFKHKRKFNNKHINDFSSFTSDYLKREWEKAKNNK